MNILFCECVRSTKVKFQRACDSRILVDRNHNQRLNAAPKTLSGIEQEFGVHIRTTNQLPRTHASEAKSLFHANRASHGECRSTNASTITDVFAINDAK